MVACKGLLLKGEDAISNAIYPSLVRGLDITVMKSPEFNTIVQSSPSGPETRIAQAQNPIWHYTLVYNYLKDGWDTLSQYAPYTDLTQMIGFFMARQGKFDDFLYDDPDDDFVGPGVIGTSTTPNTLAGLQTVNDGLGNYYSPIQKYWAGLFYEDVTDLNGAISVYANGSLQFGGGVNYSVLGPGLSIPGFASGGLYLKWIGSGSPALPVTASFHYYHRVRFDEDTEDFEKFLWQVWTVGGPDAKNGSGQIKLITSRPVAI